MAQFDLNRARAFMREHDIDGWLIYDFRNGNPVCGEVIGGGRHLTRRLWLWIPAAGEPRALAHSVDHNAVKDLPFPVRYYKTWKEMRSAVPTLVGGGRRVAMEYSPECEIPMCAWVDAGTLEFVRELGLEVVSSADLFQVAAAAWDDAARASHIEAAGHAQEIMRAAFDKVRGALAVDEPDLTEFSVQRFIYDEIARRGLETVDDLIVAVNANSGDCHYAPSAERHSPIRRGDWLLIDLWCRKPGAENVFADITWTGFCGPTPSDKQRNVFQTVIAARDAAIAELERAWAAGETLRGWQVDDATREVIEKAGYGEWFVHRTGHSMAPGSASPHALGVNIDNFETRDTRQILPGVGFSIEPGIYLPEFGARSEIDIFIDPDRGPRNETGLQTEILLLAE